MKKTLTAVFLVALAMTGVTFAAETRKNCYTHREYTQKDLLDYGESLGFQRDQVANVHYATDQGLDAFEFRVVSHRSKDAGAHDGVKIELADKQCTPIAGTTRTVSQTQFQDLVHKKQL